MVAALLHLDEGARPAVEAVDQMRRGFASTDMMSPTRTRGVGVSADSFRPCSFSALPST